MTCTRAQELDLAEFAVDSRAPAWAEFRDHYPRCPECSREVARFAALEAGLASLGAGASAHPSESELLALATPGSPLAPEERQRLEAHLAGCAPCRTELAVLRGFDFASLAAAPRHTPSLETPDRMRRAPLRRLALAAAVLLALAVPAAVWISRHVGETAVLPQPPTAQLAPGDPVVAYQETPPRVQEAPPSVPEPAPAPAAREETPPVPAATAPPASAPIAPHAPAPAAKPPRAETPRADRAVPAAKPPEPEPPRPIEIAALVPTESPHYAPGALAGGASVRVGGASRGIGGAPPPEALGPAHVGASAQPSPSLYWFLPAATSSPVEVTVVDPDAASPILEATIPGPLEPGLHRVSLAERGVRLRPGVDYRWFVAVVTDSERRSQDLVSGAAVRYAPPAGEVAARLSTAPPERAAHLYAAEGYWYDAFDRLSSWLAGGRGGALLHAHRAALLEEVGLGDAAAFERRRAADAS